MFKKKQTRKHFESWKHFIKPIKIKVSQESLQILINTIILLKIIEEGKFRSCGWAVVAAAARGEIVWTLENLQKSKQIGKNGKL
jgi:hypothetical protein